LSRIDVIVDPLLEEKGEKELLAKLLSRQLKKHTKFTKGYSVPKVGKN
jgi:hypothetical protein